MSDAPQKDEGNEPHTGVLCIRLFGVFALSWEDGDEIRVRSTKMRAMLAMLATAPEGTRTRAWLQDMLWGRSGHEHGRASLRRALTDLRVLFGEQFADLFTVNNTEVHLHLDRVRITGTLEDGDFLEGTEIAEDGFHDWIQGQRQSNRTLLTAVARARPGRIAQEIMNRGMHLHPSLAILPFATARGYQGPAQLGDMISEELSRALSRSHTLDVISHLSCRTLDARSVILEDIRDKLDADYVVCGNYRTQGEKILLNADFIDTKTGRIGWTRELTGSTVEFLKGGDELVENLAGEIRPRGDGHLPRSRRRGPPARRRQPRAADELDHPDAPALGAELRQVQDLPRRGHLPGARKRRAARLDGQVARALGGAGLVVAAR